MQDEEVTIKKVSLSSFHDSLMNIANEDFFRKFNRRFTDRSSMNNVEFNINNQNSDIKFNQDLNLHFQVDKNFKYKLHEGRRLLFIDYDTFVASSCSKELLYIIQCILRKVIEYFCYSQDDPILPCQKNIMLECFNYSNQPLWDVNNDIMISFVDNVKTQRYGVKEGFTSVEFNVGVLIYELLSSESLLELYSNNDLITLFVKRLQSEYKQANLVDQPYFNSLFNLILSLMTDRISIYDAAQHQYFTSFESGMSTPYLLLKRVLNPGDTSVFLFNDPRIYETQEHEKEISDNEFVAILRKFSLPKNKVFKKKIVNQKIKKIKRRKKKKEKISTTTTTTNTTTINVSNDNNYFFLLEEGGGGECYDVDVDTYDDGIGKVIDDNSSYDLEQDLIDDGVFLNESNFLTPYDDILIM